MDTDNRTLHYFDAEMRYLREAGKEFAQAFPDRAALLNLDKPGAHDPYVERLFEGFDALPISVRGVCVPDGALAREARRRPAGADRRAGQPAMATLPANHRFTVDRRAGTGTGSDETLRNHRPGALGFEVLSQPIGPQGTRCRYTTTQDLTLRPLGLDAVRLDREPDGRSLLRLRFNRGEMANWQDIDLAHLVLYLNRRWPAPCTRR